MGGVGGVGGVGVGRRSVTLEIRGPRGDMVGSAVGGAIQDSVIAASWMIPTGLSGGEFTDTSNTALVDALPNVPHIMLHVVHIIHVIHVVHVVHMVRVLHRVGSMADVAGAGRGRARTPPW